MTGPRAKVFKQLFVLNSGGSLSKGGKRSTKDQLLLVRGAVRIVRCGRCNQKTARVQKVYFIRDKVKGLYDQASLSGNCGIPCTVAKSMDLVDDFSFQLTLAVISISMLLTSAWIGSFGCFYSSVRIHFDGWNKSKSLSQTLGVSGSSCLSVAVLSPQ